MTEPQKRRAFVIYAYATGRINDFGYRHDDGRPMPDPDIRKRTAVTRWIQRRWVHR